MSEPAVRMDTIEDAIAAIKDGRPVVVTDDEDRENEGDLIMAAEFATPEKAKVHPCIELTGEPGDILDDLGARGVVQALVEGGATVAGEWHRLGLVDRYVLYLAPALFGGDDARPLFSGPGAATMADVWRGRIVSVVQLGDDVRVELAA